MKCPLCEKRPAVHEHHFKGKDVHLENLDEERKETYLKFAKEAEIIPLCAFCHSDVHGNQARLNPYKILWKVRKDLMRERDSIKNRMKAWEHFELDVSRWDDILGLVEGEIKEIEKEIRHEIQKHPFWSWLRRVKGINTNCATGLIGFIHSIRRYNKISSLWHDAGLHVDREGKAPKPRRGEKLHYNPEFRSFLLGIVGPSLLKQKGPYYQTYLQKKEYYEKNRDWTKDHRHKAAVRFMVKQFMKHLWLSWRNLEGLTLTEPHPQDLIANKAL